MWRYFIAAMLVAACGPEVPLDVESDNDHEFAEEPTASAQAELSNTTVLEAETMSLAPAAIGAVFSDATALGGKGIKLWSNGVASKSVLTQRAERVLVRARGDACSGAPQMVLRIDGKTLRTISVTTTSWATYSTSVVLPAGTHLIEVQFINDLRTATCDRNLYIDRVTFGVAALAASNPFARAKLYVNPSSRAAQQAAQWRTSRPVDAAQMDKIAAQPLTNWFGNWYSDIRGAVRSVVDEITARGALPVLVTYNLPNRDCGGGGVTAAAYRTWIREFSAGIGTRKAVVVLEPDGLALTGCLSSTAEQERFALLAEAVNVLTAKANIAVYIDAGNSGWLPAAEAARRLKSVGVAKARGFSLNIANFIGNETEVAYGINIVQLIGGKHFIVDTGRNGLGYAGDYCNPPGRALGLRPTAATGNARVDAYLWVKPPGESDGACNGGPAPGSWWAEYALGLARRAAY